MFVVQLKHGRSERYLTVQRRGLYGGSSLPVRRWHVLSIVSRMPRFGKDAGQPTNTAQPLTSFVTDCLRNDIRANEISSVFASVWTFPMSLQSAIGHEHFALLDPCIRPEATRHSPPIACVPASRRIPTLPPSVLLRPYAAYLAFCCVPTLRLSCPAASQRRRGPQHCHIASQSVYHSVKSPFPFTIARSEGRNKRPRQSLDSTVLLKSAPRSFACSNDIVYLAAQWSQCLPTQLLRNHSDISSHCL